MVVHIITSRHVIAGVKFHFHPVPHAPARDKAIDAYYGSPEWAKIVDEIRPLIKRREVRVMKSLPYSTLK